MSRPLSVLSIAALAISAALLTTGCKKKAKPSVTGDAALATRPAAALDAGAAGRPRPSPAQVRAEAAKGRNTPAAPAAAPSTPSPEQVDKGDFKLQFSAGAAESELVKLIREEKLFDGVVEATNQSINLPRDITVKFEKCDEADAFYDPEASEITMCQELFDELQEGFAGKSAEERTVSVVGAAVWVFLHEVGHALIHQLALPAVGREEDAADQLASIVLIAGGDEGEQLALAGAESFLSDAEASADEELAFWDEHSLDEQRFYNIICLIYGSNPDKYQALVSDGELPEERAEQCADEFTLVSTAWEKLLAPHTKQ